MTPSFVGRPALETIYLVSLALWLILEVRQALRRRPEARSGDRGSRIVVQVSAYAGVLLAALLRRVSGADFPESAATYGLSLLLIWSGTALRFWCFRTLGRYFTFSVMTSADQPVISRGPYRLLRHPSYAAILLILIGIGMSYANWLSLAALTVLPLVGFIVRIRVEEAALAASLGRAYVNYAQGRKRLVPFLW